MSTLGNLKAKNELSSLFTPYEEERIERGIEIMEISCCGTFCEKCPQYQQPCPGCIKLQGKPSWITEVGLNCCPFYACCVVDKKLLNCGQCSSAPCQLFYDTKDPSLSNEEFQNDLADRIAKLRVSH